MTGGSCWQRDAFCATLRWRAPSTLATVFQPMRDIHYSLLSISRMLECFRALSPMRPLPTLGGIGVLAACYWGTLYWFNHGLVDVILNATAPAATARQEDFQLTRDDLSSILPGQPLPDGHPELVAAPQGHPEGWIVSTLPRDLTPGQYRIEMDILVHRTPSSKNHRCVMDVFAGNYIVASSTLRAIDVEQVQHLGVAFRSPGPFDARTFQAHLFCNGLAAVSVFKVMLVHYI
jgi:hypothetical protein